MVWKAIRVVTVAPLMALLSMVTLWLARPECVGSQAQLWLALLFLTAFPLLAYPLQKLIPALREKGRAAQRKLAIIMAVAGYVCGVVFAFALKSTAEMKTIYLTYLSSGVLIAAFSRFTKLKASGHACGVAGPTAFLLYFAGAIGFVGAAFYVLAFIASLKMKRHTPAEYLTGTAIPVALLFLWVWVML